MPLIEEKERQKMIKDTMEAMEKSRKTFVNDFMTELPMFYVRSFMKEKIKQIRKRINI